MMALEITYHLTHRTFKSVTWYSPNANGVERTAQDIFLAQADSVLAPGESAELSWQGTASEDLDRRCVC